VSLYLTLDLSLQLNIHSDVYRWPNGYEEAVLKIGYPDQQTPGSFDGGTGRLADGLKIITGKETHWRKPQTADDMCKISSLSPLSVLSLTCAGEIISHAESSPLVLGTADGATKLLRQHEYTIYRGIERDNKRL
jgi:hypothetical protein